MSTWLVVGLGNPGPKYAYHRHNVGRMVTDELVRRAKVAFSAARLLQAQMARARLTSSGFGGMGAEAEVVILMTSRTYMNESGRAVAKVARCHKVLSKHIIVIHDELDLDFGRLRTKFGGGDNGHNGLRSIRSVLGTGDFYRVRVGVGRPPGRQDPADYVLSNFSAAERKALDVEIARAADAVEVLINDGLERAQALYNG